MTTISSIPPRFRPRRGFTLIEVLLTVLIIGVISSMIMVNVGATDASARLDRTAQTIIAAFRYARMQSMGHGQTSGATLQPTDAYGVAIDTTANTLTVYHATWNSVSGKWTLPGTAVSDSMAAGGTYVINLNTNPNCAGVKITSVNLTGTTDTSTNTATPYYCQYRPFGRMENPGSATAALTLVYGGKQCSISIPIVGDPEEN